MNIQDRLYELKNQITTLELTSMEIIRASETQEGREQILNIIKTYGIFEPSWDVFDKFHGALEAIYKKYNSTFDLPQSKSNGGYLDSVYTEENGYLLLRIDTSQNYNAVKIVGLPSLFYAYRGSVEEHTPELTYGFVMDCITYLQRAAQKMLSLPIFCSDKLVLSSLMYYYYINYNIDQSACLEHIIGERAGRIYDDFKHMVFETNGAHPLSIRGNLPFLSNFAWGKARGFYRWRESDPSAFVKDMKSNKALNLRKAFAEMERRLSHKFEATEEERVDEIDFTCTIGVSTQSPHYNITKKFPGVSLHPIVSFNDGVRLGILSTCMDPRRYNYAETFIGWIDYTSSTSLYEIYTQLFQYLEDDIIRTLEDNYDFLLEKLPNLRKDRLHDDMLEYIIEGL